jgi:quinol-cytochrome oxidoreductase complex cytochrome b subunit
MRPTWKSTLTLFVAGIVLLALSGIGQPGGYLKDGPSWIGAIGWFGMLACALLLIISGLYWVVSRMRPHDRPLPR